MHKNFLCKEEASFKQERGFRQVLLSVNIAILFSSNFSKFYIKSFQIKVPKHTQNKVTRHCRTALRRQLKNFSLSSGIHIPSHSCILPSQTVRHKPRPALTSVLPKTDSHNYTPPGTVPWRPCTLHTTLFLWQFSASSKTTETFVVPFNMLFKLEDATATKQEEFKYLQHTD